MSAGSNAAELVKKFQHRIRKIESARRAGLREWAIKVDNAQVNNLRGGAEPGDYPIPVRTGNLLQSHFFKVQSAYAALVGNTAAYALPVHEGSGSHAAHGPREFLQDAADSVDGLVIMRKHVWAAMVL